MSERKMFVIIWVGAFLSLTITITTGIVYGVQNNNHTNDLKRDKFVSCIHAGNKPLECAVAANGAKS